MGSAARAQTGSRPALSSGRACFASSATHPARTFAGSDGPCLTRLHVALGTVTPLPGVDVKNSSDTIGKIVLLCVSCVIPNWILCFRLYCNLKDVLIKDLAASAFVPWLLSRRPGSAGSRLALGQHCPRPPGRRGCRFLTTRPLWRSCWPWSSRLADGPPRRSRGPPASPRRVVCTREPSGQPHGAFPRGSGRVIVAF